MRKEHALLNTGWDVSLVRAFTGWTAGRILLADKSHKKLRFLLAAISKASAYSARVGLVSRVGIADTHLVDVGASEGSSSQQGLVALGAAAGIQPPPSGVTPRQKRLSSSKSDGRPCPSSFC